MIKKTIKYTDYDGNEREEDFYFNLTKMELTELELSNDGGLSKLMQKLVQENDVKRIMETFKKIINLSYGEKSLDGKRFVKNEEVLNKFIQTEAYSNLFMELTTSDEKAAAFINGIVPQIK